jgi:phosphoribosylformylglycinamidine synthase subunit PurQ / glutaminase
MVFSDRRCGRGFQGRLDRLGPLPDKSLDGGDDKMKAAVITFPGSNRDHDAASALRKAGAEVVMAWHADHALPPGTDLAVLPGGFSYGDYLRCGAIAARAPIMDAIRRHAERGGLVLGICNGFQILTDGGILPGVLMRNADLRFICRHIYLRVERIDTPFANAYREGQAIGVCVAHGEGNFHCDASTLARLEGDGLVAFRYCEWDGTVTVRTNPNGSLNAIAGIYSPNRRVLGMMPHPENLVDRLVGGAEGLPLFESLVASLATA